MVCAVVPKHLPVAAVGGELLLVTLAVCRLQFSTLPLSYLLALV